LAVVVVVVELAPVYLLQAATAVLALLLFVMQTLMPISQPLAAG
jgi:hypothetical protein